MPENGTLKTYFTQIIKKLLKLHMDLDRLLSDFQ